MCVSERASVHRLYVLSLRLSFVVMTSFFFFCSSCFFVVLSLTLSFLDIYLFGVCIFVFVYNKIGIVVLCWANAFGFMFDALWSLCIIFFFCVLLWLNVFGSFTMVYFCCCCRRECSYSVATRVKPSRQPIFFYMNRRNERSTRSNAFFFLAAKQNWKEWKQIERRNMLFKPYAKL